MQINTKNIQGLTSLSSFNLEAGAIVSEIMPVWIEIIKSFTEGLGYSYSRIAQRINVSRSAVQKLMKNPTRRPRDKIFYALCCYYYKVFYGDYRSEKAVKYIAQNQDKTLYRLVKELRSREMS